SMRVTEQIDALEVMGINSASYLILPKIISAVIVIPMLIIIAIFFALIGGYITVIITHLSSPYEFMDGLTSFFRMYDLVYVLTKTTIFAFILSSVSSFYGYRIEGGALELGKANVNGIVVSSFIILVLNLVITSIML
ncbi:MAG: ABC transporter permease, partial [Bacteroidales bacterium]|nr:ABC transporter permease [Bacteroidales bacterium]